MLSGLRTGKKRKTLPQSGSESRKEEGSSSCAAGTAKAGLHKPSSLGEEIMTKTEKPSHSPKQEAPVKHTNFNAERETDMDEAYARNIMRLGKHYKRHVDSHFGSAADGADEDDQNMDMSLFQTDRTNAAAGDTGKELTTSEKKTLAKQQQRAEHRELQQERRADAITQKCWWWLQSGSFSKFLMIALGDHVSLVLAPGHLSLVEGHCYLVPVKHAQSFCACENEVWEEISRFRASLRSMFAKEGKGIILMETVLESNSFWQARLEVLPVPKRVEQDAAMFFKSALSEQAEEWGTHTKLFKTRDKGLKGCIPKGNFPYFYVEWDDGGFAQIIESRSFPKDFGVDTVASMMEMDPLRFNRKRKDNEIDRRAVLKFVEKWKAHDWTLELP
mmetsp:Transcript_2671/g.3846  ORF Transcript_2671/g.3846 Transcript_2671/m.3846 type:complete len:388 (-) Transcript_2671:56-1219(-)